MQLRSPIRIPYKIRLKFNDKYSSWIAKLLGHSTHDGVDLACPIGTPVFNASIDGEWICRIGSDKDGLNYIITYFMTPNESVFMLLYRHLQNVKVKVGDFVLNNQLAEVGDYKLGSHLHFGVYSATDPEQFVKL